ncbi:hypothetical protein F5972_11150 [Microbispora cellulosiformans]|uniref:Uncharacterized protein n=1 Tax=Microbispora cellulosiformans TaxID=2614688 RepID=A0A5J5K465_9ACTN|nr:hypothetical protein [Microbispora cellulosiformans]KAA9378802.1 hypothetical protein F5972_11150 [Microbispora cellulosiformans]
MPITPTSDTLRVRSRRAVVRPAAVAIALAPALMMALMPALVTGAGTAAASAWSRTPAGQHTGTGDGNGNDSVVRVGNGSDNRNMVTIGSSRISGVLYQFSAGIGGVSSVQGGQCKPHVRHCVLTQKVQASASASPGTARAGRRDRTRTGERRA